MHVFGIQEASQNSKNSQFGEGGSMQMNRKIHKQMRKGSVWLEMHLAKFMPNFESIFTHFTNCVQTH